MEALTHDASTLGGNSGSAVVDVLTGQVAGLHFAGVYLDTNYAVPTWELALDPKLVDLNLNFVKGAAVRPAPRWLSVWSGLGEAPTQPLQPQPVVIRLDADDRGLGDEDRSWTIPIQVTIKLEVPRGIDPAPQLAAG